MTPMIGNWYEVKAGPHRGKRGVCDLIKTEGAGTRYRLSNRTEIVGRFAAEQLVEIPAPSYASQVSRETCQAAMDLLTGGKVVAS